MAENPCGEEKRVGVATRWTTDAGAISGEPYDYLDRPKSDKAWNHREALWKQGIHLEPGQVFDSVAPRKFFDEQRLLFHGACRSTMQFTFVVISETQAWT